MKKQLKAFYDSSVDDNNIKEEQVFLSNKGFL